MEDDVPLRQLYRVSLSLAGFDVREAGDGYDALQVIDRECPDLVILDLALPRLNGQAVREELAAQAHTRDIPVVVVTGTAAGSETLPFREDCVMRKPVHPDNIVDTVRKCLASATKPARS